MPANLSPEYKDAQEKFRRAREPQEKLECLREMLRTIPKHKGTEHLQAEIKTRLKELTDELGGPKKGAVHGGPELTVRHEGAAACATWRSRCTAASRASSASRGSGGRARDSKASR